MNAYVRFVLKYRILVIIACVAVTAASVWMLTTATLGTSMGRMFFGESPDYKRYLELVEQFGGDEVIIFGIEDVDVLSAQHLDRLERAVDRISESEDVARVMSVLDAQRMERTEDGGLEIVDFVDLARENQEGRHLLVQRLAADDRASGLLISRDGTDAIIAIEITVDPDREAEILPGLVEAFYDILVEEGFEAEAIHRTGFPAVMAEMLRESTYSLMVIFPACALILLGVVFWLFRRFWPVIVTMGVSILGVLWTMGFSVAFISPAIGLMHAMTPAVVMLVAFSDVIHLCSAYLLELSQGKDKRAAIEGASTDVGRACFYTSITTFFGFLGMTFVPTPAFRDLGWILGFGVAISLLIAITITPIFFHYMPTPTEWRIGTTSRVQNGIDRVLKWCANVSMNRAWTVILAFSIFLGVCLYGVSNLYIESAFKGRLSDNNPVSLDLDWFSDNFAEANFLDVYVKTDEHEGLYDPELFAQISAFQERLEARPDVDSALSIVDLVGEMHEKLTGETGGAPTTREAIAQYMLLFEMSGGSDLDRLVDFDRKTARIGVRLQDERMRAGYEIGVAAKEDGDANLGGATVEPQGMIYLMGGWLDELIIGQRNGLLFTFLFITAFMMFGLRSLWIGGWSMLPNALPLLAVGGLCGLMWDEVDSDTMVMAMYAIGIGVDDTVHFMMRYKTEAAREPDPEVALRNTFNFAGRAIIMTTMVLALGFAPFATSGYFSVQIMGTLLPFTLIVALVADLLLVPALVSVGLLRFPGPPAAPAVSSVSGS
jgi:predicted RND superfamily exporter protein